MSALTKTTLGQIVMSNDVVTDVTIGTTITQSSTDDTIPTAKSVYNFVQDSISISMSNTWWSGIKASNESISGVWNFTNGLTGREIKLTATGGTEGSGTIKAKLDGNASTASKLQTSRTITIKDNADTPNKGSGISFDGGSNIELPLPSTIKATINGNATTATTLASGNKIKIKSNIDNTTSDGVNFTGANEISLNLPSSISATKWKNTRTLKLQTQNLANDNYTDVCSASVDGSADFSLQIPRNATLHIASDSATTATNASLIKDSKGNQYMTVWIGTETEYSAITTKDSTTIYIVKEA